MCSQAQKDNSYGETSSPHNPSTLKKILSVFVLVFVFFALFVWLKQPHAVYQEKFFLMDTIVEIMASGKQDEAMSAIDASHKELKRIDAKFGYNNSLVTKLNATNMAEDKELYEVIQYGMGINRLSQGSFSLSLRPILDAWGFSGTHTYRIPTEAEFIKWKNSNQDSGIHLGNDGATVTIDKGMGIDVGGLAEGYGVDKAVAVMRSMGMKTGLINAGGDILCFGKRTWRIGIKHPRKSGIIAVVPIKDKAIATSGDYERYFIQDGQRYSHILDPKTGWPAQKYMSVTIIAPTCIEADAWSTAVSVLGIEKAKSILEERGIEWMVIDLSGKVQASAYLKKYCPDRIKT
jgi:thiamine biosynthesis lipoprotein